MYIYEAETIECINELNIWGWIKDFSLSKTDEGQQIPNGARSSAGFRDVGAVIVHHHATSPHHHWQHHNHGHHHHHHQPRLFGRRLGSLGCSRWDLRALEKYLTKILSYFVCWGFSIMFWRKLMHTNKVQNMVFKYIIGNYGTLQLVFSIFTSWHEYKTIYSLYMQQKSCLCVKQHPPPTFGTPLPWLMLFDLVYSNIISRASNYTDMCNTNKQKSVLNLFISSQFNHQDLGWL